MQFITDDDYNPYSVDICSYDVDGRKCQFLYICTVCVVRLADIKFGDLGRKADWRMCSLADKLELIKT